MFFLPGWPNLGEQWCSLMLAHLRAGCRDTQTSADSVSVNVIVTNLKNCTGFFRHTVNVSENKHLLVGRLTERCPLGSKFSRMVTKNGGAVNTERNWLSECLKVNLFVKMFHRGEWSEMINVDTPKIPHCTQNLPGLWCFTLEQTNRIKKKRKLKKNITVFFWFLCQIRDIY